MLCFKSVQACTLWSCVWVVKLFQLTDVSCTFVIGRFTLTSLYVSGNPIGDDGILLLIEGLDGNKVLDTLEVSDCEITIKGERCHIEWYKILAYKKLGIYFKSNLAMCDHFTIILRRHHFAYPIFLAKVLFCIKMRQGVRQAHVNS